MALITEALLKIEGKYPSIENESLWTIKKYNADTNKYDITLTELFPYNLISSSLKVKHMAKAETTVSLRDVDTYNMITSEFKTSALLAIRNVGIPMWFTIDSTSVTKNQNNDSGIEEWSYDLNLLDPVSILDFTLIANNKIVTKPPTAPEGEEQQPWSEDYMKYAQGTGTEVYQGFILKDIIKRAYFYGYVPNPTAVITHTAMKFKGMPAPEILEPANTAFRKYKTSWINTECGEITILDKFADMNYPCPIIGRFINNSPLYTVYYGPDLVVLDGELENKVMASYTAGFEQSENQAVLGMTSSYPEVAIYHTTVETNQAPYFKWSTLKNDMPEGSTLEATNTQILSLVNQKLTDADIKRFIDTQMSTLLKPWEDFILGDVLQIKINDIDGFGVVNLMVTEIGEAIEGDAITYTLTLEELEDVK